MSSRPHLANLIGLLALAIIMSVVVPAMARADDTLGAHFGFVLPLVTRSGGETTTLSDRFSIGFPTGITVKTSTKTAFDLELVPTIQRTPYVVGLTVHPGFLYALPNDFTAGLRMAFDVGKSSWGFTPLLHRQLHDMGATAVFGELVVPIRFQSDNNSIGIGVHVGIGF